jgi:multidrug transporter EmrE-like cation transporter
MVTLVAASLAFSTGGMLMKPSGGFTRLGPSLGIVVCFVIGAVLLTRAVERGGLSTTYLVGLGLEAVVSVAAGLLLLGETLTVAQGAGIVLILGGVVAVNSG